MENKLYKVFCEIPENGWTKYILANSKEEALDIANKDEYNKASLGDVQYVHIYNSPIKDTPVENVEITYYLSELRDHIVEVQKKLASL